MILKFNDSVQSSLQLMIETTKYTPSTFAFCVDLI